MDANNRIQTFSKDFGIDTHFDACTNFHVLIHADGSFDHTESTQVVAYLYLPIPPLGASKEDWSEVNGRRLPTFIGAVASASIKESFRRTVRTLQLDAPHSTIPINGKHEREDEDEGDEDKISRKQQTECLDCGTKECQRSRFKLDEPLMVQLGLGPLKFCDEQQDEGTWTTV